MTSKHTPGPWVISRYSTTYVEGPNKRGICSAGGYNDTSMDTGRVVAENEANARLIAMAPRMYEVLEALVSGYENGTGVVDKVLAARSILNQLEQNQ